MAITARLPFAARRFELRLFTIVVRGIDLTGVTMGMQVRLSPDTPGTPQLNLQTVTTSAAEGLKLENVEIIDGVPVSTISGRINKTTMSSVTGLGRVGEPGAPLRYAYAIRFGEITRIAGDFWALPGTFDADNANPSGDYADVQDSATHPFSSATLTLAENEIVKVVIDGVDVVAAFAAESSRQADLAFSSAQEAETSAAFAEEFSGPAYANVLEGETATSAGQFFRVPKGTIPETYTRYQRTAAGSLEAAPLATTVDLASTAPGKGAEIPMYRAPFAGSVDISVADALRERVSILRFLNRAVHTDVLNGTYSGDLSAVIASALDSGASLFFPGNGGSRYPIDGTMAIKNEYQEVTANGPRLEFLGTDINANAIEILSGRRDASNNTLSKTRSGLSGFRIIGPASAKYAHIIWVEHGTFAPFVTEIHSEAGNGKGFFGQIGQAFLKCDGGDDGFGAAHSKVNNIFMRNVEISALEHDDGINGPRFPQIGFWIENCIEGKFYNVISYYYKECWRMGSPVPNRNRELSNCMFYGIQGEAGKPGKTDNDKSGINFYAGEALDFFGARFDPGNQPGGTDNHVAVRFSGGSGLPVRNVSLQGGQISVFGSDGYGISIEGDADVRNLRIDPSVDLRDIKEGRLIRHAGSKSPHIVMDVDRQKLMRVTPKRARFQGRGYSFTSELAIGSGSERTQNFLELYAPDDVPILASVDVSQTFCTMDVDRNSGEGVAIVKTRNDSGGTRSVGSSGTSPNLTLRPYHEDELTARVSRSLVIGQIAAGGHSVTSVPFPGLRVGDRVEVAGRYPAASGFGQLRLYAYCPVDGQATLVAYNPSASTVDRPAAVDLTLWKVREKFDLYVEKPFDLATLGANAWSAQTLAVPGLEPGDHVVTWYSHNQDRVWMKGYAAAGNAVCILKNILGVAPAPSPTGAIRYGVFKRHRVM